MHTHFNKLTPAEAERIALLMEECGEVIQACGKILRHGYDSMYSDRTTNREQLEIEVADVQVFIDFMLNSGDISEQNLVTRTNKKLSVVNNYLHHNDIREGTVERE